MADQRSSEPSSRTKFCEHCQSYLSKSAYHEHRRKYFSNSSGSWWSASSAQALHSEDQQCGSKLRRIEHPDSDNGVQLEDMDECEDDHDDESDQLLYMESESEQDTLSIKDTADHDDLDNLNESDPELWEEENVEEDMAPQPDESSSTSSSDVLSNLMTMMIQFLLLWQHTYKISDNAMIALLKFISSYIVSIARVQNDDILLKMALSVPTTLYSARKVAGIDRDDFQTLVTCPKCHSIPSCATSANADTVCDHVEFPKHPQKKHRQPCGEKLYKQVKAKNGKIYFYPKKQYCYRSVTSYLREMAKRPHFWKECEEWKDKVQTNGDMMMDVQDGLVWRDQLEFLQAEDFRNIALMKNIDWFQPFEQSTYSLGAIYFVIQNLPREKRFLEENVMLVGLIPGPHEPSLHVNAFLSPIVDELLELQEGIFMEDESSLGHFYRAILSCLSADIPAIRKCGGFIGHSAAMGCSKCLRNFSKCESEDCDCVGLCHAGFDEDQFPARDNADHKKNAETAGTATTLAQRQRSQASHGARYSELHRLPYFDSIRFHVVDPMHNLSGTAKHLVNHWMTEGILTEQSLKEIQDEINDMTLPASIGRIPAKIKIGFSNFTADEWKKFVLIFSLQTLKGRITPAHYFCWTLFVKACTTLYARGQRLVDIEGAHQLLTEFCKQCEQLYGHKFCTINMHLLNHLKECIVDYGPIHNFRCFGFERYNGILGRLKTNNHSVGIQVMRTFVQNRLLVNQAACSESEDRLFADILTPQYKQYRGSLRQTVHKSSMMTSWHQMICEDLSEHAFAGGSIMPLPPFLEFYIDEDRMILLDVARKMYGPETSVGIVSLGRKLAKLVRNDEQYRSSLSSAEKSACIEAKWLSSRIEDSVPVDTSAPSNRAGFVEYFAAIEFLTRSPGADEERKKVYFAKVKWLKIHPHRHHYPRPCQVWCRQYEVTRGTFVPVERIISTCVVQEKKVRFPDGLLDTVYVTLPVYQNFPLWST